MIERLLAAEESLARGEIEHAERLFAQVAEADARNAIAIVGLARIAERRGDTDGARTWLRRALAIDPDEAAAKRLLRELDAGTPQAVGAAAPASAATPAAEAEPNALAAKPVSMPGAATPSATTPAATPPSPRVGAPAITIAPRRARRLSLLGRIRRWLGRGARR